MKKLVLIILVAFSLFESYAQTIVSVSPENSVISINSKLTLKLITFDSVNYTYNIVKSEPFTDLINIYEHNELLYGPIAENTIELIFCRGTHGDTKKEKEKNLMTLLMIKNGTNNTLTCIADQIRSYDMNFKSDHVLILHPKLKLTENWLFVFDKLYLHDLRINN